MDNKINALKSGFHTAFVDQMEDSNIEYRPEFVSNNYKQGKKVLVSIEQELAKCNEFKISVAFITKSGITPLLQTLKELEQKNIPGQILTTDYLMFSEPEALEKLAALKNIELKMFKTTNESGGFHTKGYIFRQQEIYKIIIGSSNLTLSAITKNREWNTKLVSTQKGYVVNELLDEFNELWTSHHSVNFNDFIQEYREAYKTKKLIEKQQKIATQTKLVDLDAYKLKPNKMQVAFSNNLLEMYHNNIDRALLLSSTGTGKTYASAFALREMQPKKVLFLVHREQIAKQALASYKKIFNHTKTYGLVSGNSREMEEDFIFSTMQMMTKEDIHQQYQPDEFDVIVLDECHHVGSQSYQRIMNYFQPKFWLGMTASPETNNYDIYEIFDHNIAYEIRLQQALEQDLLCPFHYFGITDLEINGEVFDDEAGVKNFANLVSDERVHYIIKNAKYYGYSGERVKGLIFCSTKNEAKELSAKFNQQGLRTEVLTGEDNQARREKIIDRLVDDQNIEDQLDYIFSVDIFNEGVDIPEVNQVIMLRPTESPVVFIQQLGRGLRRFNNKEYVVILDFIGNYMNNFMIPIALSGDRSYNKDTIRRYVNEGTKVIPGCSTIHFDEISRKRIYDSIDAAKTNDMKLLKDAYLSLKYKLGRIPTIGEFKEYGSVDIHKIFNKFGSYYSFLKKYEKENYKINLLPQEEEIIEYLSTKLLAYKRIQDLAILSQLIIPTDKQGSIQDKVSMNLLPSTTYHSVLRNLRNEFPKNVDQKKYAHCVLVEEMNTQCQLTSTFKKMLENTVFKNMVVELLQFGVSEYKEKYANTYKDTNFVLYEKYSYEDVCRLLNWQQNMNAQNIGGYFYDKETKTFPVFINYHKTDDAIAYEDRFVSENCLIALSKQNRSVDSMDAQRIFKRGEENQNNRIYLFVRKNKDDKEAKEFYFLGEIEAMGEPKDTEKKTFEVTYHLETPVRNDIYDYLTTA